MSKYMTLSSNNEMTKHAIHSGTSTPLPSSRSNKTYVGLLFNSMSMKSRMGWWKGMVNGQSVFGMGEVNLVQKNNNIDLTLIKLMFITRKPKKVSMRNKKKPQKVKLIAAEAINLLSINVQ